MRWPRHVLKCYAIVEPRSARVRGSLVNQTTRSKIGIEKRSELRLGDRPYFGGFHFTVFEQHQGWDAAHTIVPGCIRVVVDIEFDDFKPALLTAGNLLQNGSDHLAGAAPVGPEINQNGSIGI